MTNARMTVCARALLLSTALVAPMTILSAPAQAAAQDQATVNLNIPAQELGSALSEFARQSRQQLLYAPELARGKKSSRVNGNMSAEAGLRQLLSGTDLKVSTSSGGAFVLSTGNPQGNALAGAPNAGTESASSSGDDAVAEVGGVSSGAEILVTGSRLKGIATRVQSVTTYDRKYIENSNATTIEDFARRLPENFSSVDNLAMSGLVPNPAGGASIPQLPSDGRTFGASTFNLRGLGPGSTLVLINGTRLSAAGSDASFTDVSSIPLAAVDRIEILGEGASAIYGADAVAGVVNIITRRDFKGALSTVRVDATDDGGASAIDLSQLLGTRWRGGSGFLALNYRKQDELLSDQRSFIPDQSFGTGVPKAIIPKQKTYSAMLNVSQDLGQGTIFSLGGSFSRRTSDGLTTIARLPPSNAQFSHTSNELKTYAASSSLTVPLSVTWVMQLAADASKVKQRQEGLGTRLLTPDVISQQFRFSPDTSTIGGSIQASGDIIELPAGPVQLALGASLRKDRLKVDSVTTAPVQITTRSRYDRTIASAYAELFVPVYSEANGVPFIRQLSFSVAGRLDRYNDFGRSIDPRFAALWSPVGGVEIRGSYSTAFRPPRLPQLVGAIPTYIVLPVPEGAGTTNTVFISSSSREDLDAEKAKSFTLGVTVRPKAVPGLEAKLTYFKISFRNRISSPPVGLFDIFNQEDAVADLIDRNPTSSDILSYYTSSTLINPFAIPAASVSVVYDNRIANLAKSKVDGLDMSINYSKRVSFGTLGMFFGGTIQFNNKFQITETATPVNLLDTVGQPVSFRARGGLTLTSGGLNAGLTANHVNGYENIFFTPSQRVGSWTTIDMRVSYEFQQSSGLLRGLVAAAGIDNVTNNSPPAIRTPASLVLANPGFDARNASPLGRRFSLSLSKRW